MSDTPDTPAGPSDEDVAKWTAAIHEIMDRDGVTEEEANSGLVWALTDADIQEQIKELEEARKTQEGNDVAKWTAVIRDLQERFPQWTEQEANDNLVNLLSWVEAHPQEA